MKYSIISFITQLHPFPKVLHQNNHCVNLTSYPSYNFFSVLALSTSTPFSSTCEISGSKLLLIRWLFEGVLPIVRTSPGPPGAPPLPLPRLLFDFDRYENEICVRIQDFAEKSGLMHGALTASVATSYYRRFILVFVS